MLTACSLTGWIDAANNTEKIDPEWDLSIRLPVVDKTIHLKDYMKDTAININNITTPTVLSEWPQNTGSAITLPVGALSLPIVSTIDFNGDAVNDFNLTGFYSENASIKLKISLLDGTTEYALEASDITMPSQITIENITYNISPAIKSGNYLYYSLTNSNEYYINFGGDSTIDILGYNVTLNSNTPRYTIGGTFDLKIEASLSLGDDFGIVGKIINTGSFINETDIEVPISDLPLVSIENFTFELIFDSGLPFDMGLDMTFTADVPPVPNTFNTVFYSGNLSTINGYKYVISSTQTKSNFTFMGDLMDYTNLKMDYSVNFPVTANTILISTENKIRIRINISGDSTINL
jgi:hypothetical protein